MLDALYNVKLHHSRYIYNYIYNTYAMLCSNFITELNYVELLVRSCADDARYNLSPFVEDLYDFVISKCTAILPVIMQNPYRYDAVKINGICQSAMVTRGAVRDYIAANNMVTYDATATEGTRTPHSYKSCTYCKRPNSNPAKCRAICHIAKCNELCLPDHDYKTCCNNTKVPITDDADNNMNADNIVNTDNIANADNLDMISEMYDNMELTPQSYYLKPPPPSPCALSPRKTIDIIGPSQ